MLLLTDGQDHEEKGDKLYAVGFIVTAVIIFVILAIVVGVGYANNSTSKMILPKTPFPSKTKPPSTQIPAGVISPPKKTQTLIQEPTSMSTPSPTFSPSPTSTSTPTPTPTNSPTLTPTNTPTPTLSSTPSISPTP